MTSTATYYFSQASATNGVPNAPKPEQTVLVALLDDGPVAYTLKASPYANGPHKYFLSPDSEKITVGDSDAPVLVSSSGITKAGKDYAAEQGLEATAQALVNHAAQARTQTQSYKASLARP